MLLPCEKIIKYFIPAIRAGVTKELSKRFDFKQEEIALRLGITQAAVSKYLNGKYNQKIKLLEKKRIVKSLSREIALSIARNEIIPIQFSKFCKCCEFTEKICGVRK